MFKTQKINNFEVTTLPNDSLSVDKIKGGELFAKLYCSMFFLALTESGKTTVIYNVLKKCCGRTGADDIKRTKVIFFVPTIYEDSTYKYIVKWLKKHDFPFEIHTSLFEGGVDVLKQYIDNYAADQEEEFYAALESDDEEDKVEQPTVIDTRYLPYEMIFPSETTNEPKRKEKPPKKIASKFIFILDDISGELKKSSTFANFLKSSRHMKAKVIVSSQHLNDIPLQARTQLSYLLLWPLISEDKLKEAHDNFAIPLPIKNLIKLYKDATKAPPGEKSHSFLYIDLKRGLFRKNFNTLYDIENSL